MNNLQLKTRAGQILGAAGSGTESAEEWQLLQDLANEAVIDMLSRTKVAVRGLVINLIAGTQEYDLGTSVLRMFDVRRGTTPLRELTMGDVLDAASDEFAIIGFNRVYLGYVPSTGDQLNAWYVKLPTAMAADGDDPSADAYGDIPVQFHPFLLNYMCWKGADIIGDAGSGRGEKYRILYEGQDGLAGPGSNLGAIKAAVNMRAGSGAQRRRVRRSEDRMYGDAYPDAWIG